MRNPRGYREGEKKENPETLHVCCVGKKERNPAGAKTLRQELLPRKHDKSGGGGGTACTLQFGREKNLHRKTKECSIPLASKENQGQEKKSKVGRGANETKKPWSKIERLGHPPGRKDTDI